MKNSKPAEPLTADEAHVLLDVLNGAGEESRPWLGYAGDTGGLKTSRDGWLSLRQSAVEKLADLTEARVSAADVQKFARNEQVMLLKQAIAQHASDLDLSVKRLNRDMRNAEQIYDLRTGK